MIEVDLANVLASPYISGSVRIPMDDLYGHIIYLHRQSKDRSWCLNMGATDDLHTAEGNANQRRMT